MWPVSSHIDKVQLGGTAMSTLATVFKMAGNMVASTSIFNGLTLKFN